MKDPSDISNHHFSNDEDILEALMTPENPCNDILHRPFFIPDEPSSWLDQFSLEVKYFIHGSVDWFKSQIPTPEAFEEGNMANISPTIKFYISMKPRILKDIVIDASFSPEEDTTYKTFF